ncbi:MAG TPA: tyrosinase family protein [Solirubrobacteraceae bacterium]|nr:tyrosinase family protein [Solirubrobacteraceae bacterium]
MKARADADHTSWSYQAAMHGTHQRPLAQLWNGCKHYSWYFVAWHRMFVFCFEEIVRAAIVQAGGPADWALPYWNYELGGEHASIPEAFREPNANGAPNPLYVQQRAPGINEGAQLQPAATTSQFALARPNFVGTTEFGGGEAPPTPQFWREPGELEETPHNAVHGQLGGRGGWMNDPDRAAQDPIFWLHHAQIDRLWARWNSQGRINPVDPAWSGQAFGFFDVDGQLSSKSCADVLDTVADLGYEYDQLTP